MSGESRRAERRIGDRRASRRASATEGSWFGELSGSADLPPDDAAGADDTRQQSVWGEAEESQYDEGRGDSRIFSREAERIVSSGATAFERLYRTFIGSRAALGIALVVALALAGMFGLRPEMPVAAVSIVYAVLAVGLWVLPAARRTAEPQALARLHSPRWLATIGVDLICFSALHVLSPGSSLNFVALLVLPVLMAGVLTPRPMALGTAAAVTLVLLATAGLGGDGGAGRTVLLTQAALAGSGFFVISVLAGELAGRLAREERSARGSLEFARQQAQLNQLVIEEMQDGVLVVDRRGRVRAANPAARRLLASSGLSRAAPFQLRGVPAWQALVETVERAFAEATWPETGRDATLPFEGGSSRTLRVRVRFTQRRESHGSEELCVLFLEDVRNMQARSRQEKLAAMGRVSAGIAHEIRNPLAAIAQANALMSEDATDPAQRRLMHMVADNVERLKRIVDDVMEVAPGPVLEVSAIDATAQVAAVCAEWAQGTGVRLGESSVLRVELPSEPLGVGFDAEHLRRVLVNLLDNGYRHASRRPGSVVLRLESRDETRAFLSVSSDGAPIPPDVERHLFEPFFSTRSRGTGLGLYICRELCERYGASIDFRARTTGDTHTNEFFVVMRRMAPAATEARLHLSP